MEEEVWTEAAERVPLARWEVEVGVRAGGGGACHALRGWGGVGE